MKKFVTFATAGALAFAGLGLGAVGANAAGSAWDDPNAGENYFTYEADYGGGVEITGLNDTGKELAKREPVISLPYKNKDKDVTAIDANLANYGVTGIKSWGGVKRLVNVGDVKIPDNWGEITRIASIHPINLKINTLPKSWGNVTSIGADAFKDSEAELVLPESWGQVRRIEAEAFADSNISALPKSWGNVEEIYTDAFRHNNLTSIPADWGKVKEVRAGAFELNRIHAIPNDFAGVKDLFSGVFANEGYLSGDHKIKTDQEIKSGGVYRLPAESLTADFKESLFNWIDYDDKQPKTALCTYDGTNPNDVKSDIKVVINDPERCKEVKPAEPAPKTEAPSQPAPAQPEPGILTPAQPAPQQPAPQQPAPKVEPTPAPAPAVVPASTQTEVKPRAEVKPGVDANANASAANANASAANASAANANGVATAKQNSAVLAETGSDLTVLGAAGVALLALAGAATLVARRVKH